MAYGFNDDKSKVTMYPASDIDTMIGTQNAEIASIRAAIGTPLVASTASQMTDTDKIYVYVGSEAGYTSGNWYYYNGSTWVSGGVYNSTAFQTDNTLTIAGAAADAKAVGDLIFPLGLSVVDGALNITYNE